MSAGERIKLLEASALTDGLERALERLADAPDDAGFIGHVGRAIIEYVINGGEPAPTADGIVAVGEEIDRKIVVTLYTDGRWLITIATSKQRRRAGELTANSIRRISVSPAGDVAELKIADVSLEISA